MNIYPKVVGQCALCSKEIIAKDSSFDKPNRKYCSNSCRGRATWTGRKHSDRSKQIISLKNTKHGSSYLPQFKVWHEIIRRCKSPSCRSYKNYGGRGIKVCPEWQNFEKFNSWCLENGYVKGITIERINNNGNYDPQNCKFIDRKEQSKNRRPSNEWKYK